MTPKGWQNKPLQQVAVIQTGIAKGSKKIKTPLKLPYLRVANVQDGYLDLEEIKEIDIDLKDVERFSLKYGDVLLTEGGDFDKLGRGTIWKEQIKLCLHQNHIFVVRPNPLLVLPDFLSYLTGSKYGKIYFQSCSKQSTNLASINSTQLKQFPVIFPSIEKQRKIVLLISTWQLAIEKSEIIINKHLALKEAILNKLFSLERSSFASFTLNELGDCIRGLSYKPDDLCDNVSNNSVEILRANNINNGSINFNNTYFIKSNKCSESKLLKANDVIICMSSGSPLLVGKAAIFDECLNKKVTIGAFCAIFRCTKMPLINVIKHFFQSNSYSKQLSKLTAGTNIKNLKPSDILQLKIQISCNEHKLNKYVEVLNTLDKKLYLLRKYHSLLEIQKQEILQKILNGKWKILAASEEIYE
jgi:type I restriction enzyme, S subunit